MPAEVGSAYVSIIPTTRGFQSQLNRQITPPIAKTGTDSGKRYGKAFGIGFKALGAGAIVGTGLGLLGKSAASAEADFSQTMNTLGAVTKIPQTQVKILSDLALQLGKDTIFSASEAADAMLELAKGGITPAQIQAGALAETLRLAAAGGTDLATSSTILANAMNTFGLDAKDAPKITAALAGGANASTASIGSLGEALAQVGPGAKQSGLSIQETVAALAAFDNAGVKGSDAGTALKTMLQRLVPQTAKARKGMDKLGLKFTDAEGNFLPLVDVAGQLQKALGDLSEEQRSKALNQIFGSDASRAAGILADQGAKGIRNFVKATRDQNAAQEIADARMKGTAGSLEKLKGSFETAKLTIGQAIAPAVQAGADLAARALNGLADKVPGWVAAIRDPFGTFQQDILPKLKGFYKYVKNTLIPGVKEFAETVLPQIADTIGGVADSIGEVFAAFTPKGDGIGKAKNDFALLKTAAQLLVVQLKIVKTNVRILAEAFKVFTFVPRMLAGFAAKFAVFFVRPILNALGFIINAAAKAFGWIPIIGPKLKAAADKFAAFKTRAFAALDGFGAKGAQLGTDFTANLAAAILGSNRKVSAAVAVGTANKVRANSTALLGVDSRKTKAGDGLTVVVNNPKAERASESVPTAIQRATRAAGWAAA